MPILNIRAGEIYYEVHGSGFPLMIFAPGGLRSELAFWRHSPSNPSAAAVWMDPMAVLGKKYRVVAMDQRNAGRSRMRIDASDDWHTYAGDQLALADHLGHPISRAPHAAVKWLGAAECYRHPRAGGGPGPVPALCRPGFPLARE